MKFYSLYPEDNSEQGVAYAPDGVTFKVLYRKGKVAHWKPIDFTLKDGAYTDYQWNNLGWHLCSNELKQVFTECAGPDDTIQWLPVTVTSESEERRDYHILHLPLPSDVLSKTRTVMSGDVVVKPVLNASKLGRHGIFTFSNESGTVYVNAATRRRIRATKFTGLDFLTVPTVPSD